MVKPAQDFQTFREHILHWVRTYGDEQAKDLYRPEKNLAHYDSVAAQMWEFFEDWDLTRAAFLHGVSVVRLQSDQPISDIAPVLAILAELEFLHSINPDASNVAQHIEAKVLPRLPEHCRGRSVPLFLADQLSHVDPRGSIADWTRRFFTVPQPLDYTTHLYHSATSSTREFLRFVERVAAPFAKFWGCWDDYRALENAVLFHKDRQSFDEIAGPSVTFRRISNVTARYAGESSVCKFLVDRVTALLELHAANAQLDLKEIISSQRWEWKHIASLARIVDIMEDIETKLSLHLHRCGFVTLYCHDEEGCYRVLRLLHRAPHHRYEIRDYLDGRTEDGYRALHTVVEVGHEHNDAPRSVAIRLIPSVGNSANTTALKDLTDDRIDQRLKKYQGASLRVYTPAGQPIDLVPGSTILNFVYKISSQLVGQVKSARINDRHYHDLLHPLGQGDVIDLVKTDDFQPLPKEFEKSVPYHQSIYRQWKLNFNRMLVQAGRKGIRRELANRGLSWVPNDELMDNLFSRILPTLGLSVERDIHWWLKQLGYSEYRWRLLDRTHPREKWLSLDEVHRIGDAFVTAMENLRPEQQIPVRPLRFVLTVINQTGVLNEVVAVFSRRQIEIVEITGYALQGAESVIRVCTSGIPNATATEVIGNLKRIPAVRHVFGPSDEVPPDIDVVLPQLRTGRGAITYRSDPYSVGPPVELDEQFYGRARELERLFALVGEVATPYRNTGMHVFISGPFRSGKTSLALQFARDLRRGHPQPAVVAYHKCEGNETSTEVQRRLATELLRKIGTYVAGSEAYQLLAETRLETLVQHLRNSSSTPVVALIIDEAVGMFRRSHYIDSSRQDLGAMLSFVSRTPGVIAIWIGPRWPLIDSPSPLRELTRMQEIRLAALSREELYQLVMARKQARRVVVPDHVLESIWAWTQGDVMFAAAIASEIFNAKFRTGSATLSYEKADVSAAVVRTIGNASFEGRLGGDPDSRRGNDRANTVMARILYFVGEVWARRHPTERWRENHPERLTISDQSLIAALGDEYEQDALKRAVDQLQARGILTYDDIGGQLEVVPLLARYLCERPKTQDEVV